MKLPYLQRFFSTNVASDSLVDAKKAHCQKNIKDCGSVRENSRLTQRSATALYTLFNETQPQ